MPDAALVTGATAGLGAEFARQLAAMGKPLVLVAQRPQRLEEMAEQLSDEFAVPVTVVAADLSAAGAPQHIVEQLLDQHIHINFLVNNAGAGGPDLLQDIDPVSGWAEHAAYLQLMMISMAELCHRLMPGMLERGYGRVINVSSVAGRFALAGDCHYGPSKAYVVALSEALAASTAERNVNVCALCPGFTHTEFHAEGRLREMKAQLPEILWYPAATVVADALAAVEKGRDICISGRLYRWLDPLLQIPLSRKLLKWGLKISQRRQLRRNVAGEL